MSKTQIFAPDWDVAIIGGGAAGFFAAAEILRLAPHAKVIILERSGHFLTKVRASGGGRCNLTNTQQPLREFVKNYPRGEKELLGAFSRFGPSDTIRWFEDKGVSLKTEAEGRVFPVSDSSEEIVNCLIQAARTQGCCLRTQCEVQSVSACPNNEQGYTLRISGSAHLHTRCVLMTTGGASRHFALPVPLGHHLETPVPALFSLTIQELQSCKGQLAGLTLDDASGVLTCGQHSFPQRGALLFTHTGVSGPLALRLSSWAARALAEHRYQGGLTFDLSPQLSFAAVEQVLRQHAEQHRQGKMGSSKPPSLSVPARLWEFLLQQAELNPQKKWAEVSRKEYEKLASAIKKMSLKVIGKAASGTEFVTCGGVPLHEIDMRTMESRFSSALYFAGEVLNIDAVTGGFNLQNAWTTAWISAQAIAGRILGQQ